MHSELFALHPSFVDHVTDRKSRSVRERHDNAGPAAYLTNGSDRMAIGSTDVKRQSKLTAVVPLWGTLARHPSWFADMSTAEFSTKLRQLDANDSVSTILLHVNSPGGTVTGTVEAADCVFAIRKRGATRVVAVVDSMMASAACWIASAASEVVCTPSSETGSIGVLSVYTDVSRALEQNGIEVSVERIPELKARYSGVEALTPAMRDTMRQRIEKSYGEFVAGMARNRNVSTSTVTTRFGNGEMLDSREAVAAGLCDRISTFDECLADCLSGRRTNGRRAAAASSSSSAARWRRLRLIEVDL